MGLAVIGRPVARMLPQDGSVGELLRFVLEPGLPRWTASYVLRVAVETFARWVSPRRRMADAMITYHDRSRHSGCIYRKAGFRKNGTTRAGTRRGSWGTRPDREQAVSSEEPNKRRWRIDLEVVRRAIAERKLVGMQEHPIPGKEVSRQTLANYALVEQAPAGHNTVGFTYLETACVGKCPHVYRIDPGHPSYAEVKAGLDRGDRSVIFCYHKPVADLANPLPSRRRPCEDSSPR